MGVIVLLPFAKDRILVQMTAAERGCVIVCRMCIGRLDRRRAREESGIRTVFGRQDDTPAGSSMLLGEEASVLPPDVLM